MSKPNRKNPLSTAESRAAMRRVLAYIRPYRFYVAASLLVAAGSVGAQLYIPLLCGDAIDRMLGPGQVDRTGVPGILLHILIVTALAAFAQWVLSVCNNKITFSVTRDLRNDAIHKIQSLPLSYLDSHPAGDIVSRMVADVDTFADGLLMGFTQLFTGLLTILGTLLFMFRENVLISLVVVLITPPQPGGGGVHRQPLLRLLPPPERRPRRADRPGQRDDRGAEGGAGLWPRGREPGRL